jgi:hypothetical protein
MSKYVYHINSNQSHRGHLGFFPHKSPMPKISSTDRLLMVARDMTDALRHTHACVPFATIEDDTITALTTVAAILKNKFKKPLAPEIKESPIKAAEKNA